MLHIDYDANTPEVAQCALGVLLDALQDATLGASWNADNEKFDEGLRAMPAAMRNKFRKGLINGLKVDSEVRAWVLRFGLYSHDLTVCSGTSSAVDIADASSIYADGPPPFLDKIAEALSERRIAFCTS